ncbi:hypothetical protein ACL1FS_14075, partial [Corynebacterium striatum]
ATPADRGAANINYERKPLAVPGTWNPGTNYADSRYQLPQIDTLAAGIELVRKGVRVHTAARQVGVSDPVLRRQACKLGLCVPV